jgi:hypothetical protein
MHGREEEYVQARRNETTRKSLTKVGDNIKMDLRELGWGGMGWIRLVQDTGQWLVLLYMIMNLQFR